MKKRLVIGQDHQPRLHHTGLLIEAVDWTCGGDPGHENRNHPPIDPEVLSVMEAGNLTVP